MLFAAVLIRIAFGRNVFRAARWPCSNGSGSVVMICVSSMPVSISRCVLRASRRAARSCEARPSGRSECRVFSARRRTLHPPVPEWSPSGRAPSCFSLSKVSSSKAINLRTRFVPAGGFNHIQSGRTELVPQGRARQWTSRDRRDRQAQPHAFLLDPGLRPPVFFGTGIEQLTQVERKSPACEDRQGGGQAGPGAKTRSYRLMLAQIAVMVETVGLQIGAGRAEFRAGRPPPGYRR